MKRFIKWLYLPYQWLVFAPTLVVTTLTCALLILIVALFNPNLASMTLAVLWARINSYVTPMLVKVKGRNNVNKHQSYVIISNHQSQYDILLLYGWLGIDFKWIMKQELRKVPGLGVACYRMGHIFIDRSNHQQAVAAINAAKYKIVNGTSILFFPEGTRSKDGKLSPFKKGAFKIALELGIPILPITINGTYEILPAKSLNIFPGRASMTIHPPISIQGYDETNIDELIHHTRQVIASGLAPKYQPRLTAIEQHV